MRCEEARQLFDAYLDGELSSALATELGAHRLRCAECRRALALMEVTGHILAADREPAAPVLDEGFENRLLACMQADRRRRQMRWRRAAYIGGPLAAAAVVGFALVGGFDVPRRGVVAGLEQPRPADVDSDAALRALEEFAPPSDPASHGTADAIDPQARAVEEWLERTEQQIDALQGAFDLTIYQTLDILEEARQRSEEAESPVPSPTPAPLGSRGSSSSSDEPQTAPGR